MTAFEAGQETAVETPAVVPIKPIETPIPDSRVKSDPELWRQSGELADMLSYCRPDGSRAEKKFIAKYLVPLGVTFDKKGNVYKRIGDNPNVLWSAHTDTVHAASGTQKVVYWLSKKTGECHFEVDQTAKTKTSCLGADDTAGIWLMIEMIKANIPGLYIFHRGEEVGGKGSKFIVEKRKEVVDGIKYAIAFDRRDEKSIITYQRGTRCCSDEFANALADQLGLGHKCDTGGSFTDTASYVDLIPECTNVSVGYYNAHSSTEYLNVDYLFRLRDALLKLDVSKLVEKRKAGENEALYKSYSYSGGKGYHGGYYDDCFPSWGEFWRNKANTTTGEKPYVPLGKGWGGHELKVLYEGSGFQFFDHFDWDTKSRLWFPNSQANTTKETKTSKPKDRYASAWKPTYQDMLRLIRLNPEIVADLLEQFGYDPVSFREYLLSNNKQTTIHL